MKTRKSRDVFGNLQTALWLIRAVLSCMAVILLWYPSATVAVETDVAAQIQQKEKDLEFEKAWGETLKKARKVITEFESDLKAAQHPNSKSLLQQLTAEGELAVKLKGINNKFPPF